VIESNYTARCTTKRGLKTTATADAALDLEAIVFNETVTYFVKCIRDKLPIVSSRINLFKPEFIEDIFSKVLESEDKVDLFNQVKEKVAIDMPSALKTNSEIFTEKGFKDFQDWLGYRSTYFTLAKHIGKVYGNNISCLFSIGNEMKNCLM
jgi:hypothetical protein